MGRPGRRMVNPGWFKPGHDPRRHPLTHDERARGGVKSYGLLLRRPKAAWWVLNERIWKQARAARDEALRQLIERRHHADN